MPRQTHSVAGSVMPVATDSVPAQGQQDAPRLVTVSDAAKILSTSKTTIYALMTTRNLPYVKIGRSRRIELSALKAFVDMNRQAS